MGAECKKCGMRSDRDDICTWCNADITQPQAAAGAQPAPTQRQPSVPAAPEAEQAPERPVWLFPVGAVAAGVVVLVVALTLVGMAASGPPPEPGEWGAITAKDNSFAAHYPAGWGEPSNSGSPGSYVMVEWKPTKLCRVVVRGSATAGAVGDGAVATERDMAEKDPRSASILRSRDGRVLIWNRDYTDFTERRPGYEEGEAVFAYDFANVRSAMVEYEYSRRAGLLRVEMKGVRWGSHQGDYGYHVFAEAPAKHWDEFRPVAEQIIGSVQFGGGG